MQFLLKNYSILTKLGSIYTCKYAEGGFRHRYTLSGLGAAWYRERYMAYLSLRPCGLGCQQLGPRRYNCIGHNFIRGHLVSGRITSHPAPLSYSPGEDNSS